MKVLIEVSEIIFLIKVSNIIFLLNVSDNIFLFWNLFDFCGLCHVLLYYLVRAVSWSFSWLVGFLFIGW